MIIYEKVQSGSKLIMELAFSQLYNIKYEKHAFSKQ